ncbi:UNVERIFIED_CONTAM: uncharacterized protein DUF222 [Williamsia faeni]
MSDTPTAAPAPDAVSAAAEVEAAIERLLAADLTVLSEEQSARLVEKIEVGSRKLSYAGLTAAAGIDARRAYAKAGYPSTYGFLKGQLRLGDGAVKRRIAAMNNLVSRITPTGEVLDPLCPATSELLRHGVIDLDHIHAILGTLGEIPSNIAAEERASAERTMAGFAADYTPTRLSALGDRLIAHLNPDGSLTDEGDRVRKRSLHRGRQDKDLMGKITGRLDPTTLALFDVLLAIWAAPGMNDPGNPDSPSGAADDPAIDAEVLRAAAQLDSRSQDQRNHDALSAMLKYLISSGQLGNTHNGLPAQLIITLSKADLEAAAGVAHTATGVDIPVDDLVDLAADCDPNLAVFKDGSSEVLYYGRARRGASMWQRMAMVAAQRGCTHPGCDQPAAWSQAHHGAQDWADGGLTDIDSLAWACGPHNRLVGDGPGQWRTFVVPDGPDAGKIAWVPPEYIDPERRPRINRVHHPDEALARARAALLAARREAAAARERELRGGAPGECDSDPDPPEVDDPSPH